MNLLNDQKRFMGDSYDYSKVNYISCSKKVIVICKKHGEFLQKPSAHLFGQGCQKCYGNQRSTTKEFIEKSRKVHGNKYDYSKANYTNAYSKVKIICKEHGEFLQSPTGHLGGKGCLKCSGVEKSTASNFINKSKKIHGNKYDYSKVNYINNRTYLKIICKKHGEFLQTPHCHLSGHECGKCADIKRRNSNTITTEEFIRKSKHIHENKYEYSLVNYIHGNSKVKIICKLHGIFLQTPNNHSSGSGCIKCRDEKQSQYRSSNTTEFIKKSNILHKNKYDYSKVNYINNYTKIKIICKKHGGFLQSPYSHFSGNGCSKCSSIISKPEIEFLNHCLIPNKIENRQKRINRFKIDGYDDKTNTIYEFLGDYYHGNPERFNSNDINKKCKLTFGELYNKTFEKFNDLKQDGYNIKYIWESDWNKYKKGVEIKPKIISYL